MALRKQLNGYLPEDEKLSVNDFIVKAVALALREFSNLNASFAGDKVIHHGRSMSAWRCLLKMVY